MPRAAWNAARAIPPTWLVALCAAVIAAFAFRRAHDAIIVGDGSVYMEMAKQFGARGSLEVPNGLDIVDSPELSFLHTVKIGRHLYAKYPVVYAALAALPFRLAGVRGLFLLNAIGLFAVTVTFHRLAVRVLSARAALLGAVALPVATPLFSLVLLEAPHLSSAALLLLAVLACARADEATAPRSVFVWSVISGLFAGASFGVRLQNVAPAAILPINALMHRSQRSAALAGQTLGQLAVLAVMGAVNLPRFGDANPFSYGPPGMIGSPGAEETLRYVAGGGFVTMFALIAAAVALPRVLPARMLPVAGAAGVLLVAAVEPVRSAAVNMGQSMVSFLINVYAFYGGWSRIDTTFEWMNKPLLVAVPVLAIGLVAMLAYSFRPAPLVVRTAAWMSLAAIVFLSIRCPDASRVGATGTTMASMGFLSLSPRYLADIVPLLSLAGLYLVRGTRPRLVPIVLALVPAAFVWRLLDGPDSDPTKLAWLLYGTIALAAVVAVLLPFRRAAFVGPVFVFAFAFAALCGTASCFREDVRALEAMGAVHERWTRALAGATPAKFVLVAWEHAADAVFGIRADRDVVFVDCSWKNTDGPLLLSTLEPFAARGVPIYFFGMKFEAEEAALRTRYDITRVLADPILFRLEPRALR